MTSRILVTGGAGYIGSRLVPKLLQEYDVTLLDPLWFEERSRMVLDEFRDDARFNFKRGDIRDRSQVEAILDSQQIDTIIHLAAVSNDPCSLLDPELTRAINLDATSDLMRLAKRHGVKRFLNASSASVYGIKDTTDVTEDLPLEPITLYAQYKAETEQILNELVDDSFCGVSVRSATVCGYSPRLRLDLTINILTAQAVTKGRIRVFGGSQMRPNIHIDDLVDFYRLLIDADAQVINGRAFNVSRSNATVRELAEMVRENVDPDLPVDVETTEDNRSYHLSARLAADQLGFVPARSLDQAIREVSAALTDGRVPSPDASIYRNIDIMRENPRVCELSTEEMAR